MIRSLQMLNPHPFTPRRPRSSRAESREPLHSTLHGAVCEPSTSLGPNGLRLALALVVLATGCGLTEIKLENFPRPFACDRNGGDGGVQCAEGWVCGYDDRCFEKNLVLDGGQHVELWQCSTDSHCPTGWKCGQEVDSLRNCQQLGVGAPSPCVNDDGGCEGGWRCAASERCFDPSDRDGGTTRDCTRDGECPNGFRCGQKVGLLQLCIELDAGADSLCLDDLGCEGSWRCNLVKQRCVSVPDRLTTGQTSGLGAQELNPRVYEPAPLLFAMSRNFVLPLAFSGIGQREGVWSAALFADGGLRVQAQFQDEQANADGGPALMLHERRFGLRGSARDVTDLVLSFDGPVVRYADAGTERLLLADAGWEPLGPSTFLRQRDWLEGPPRPTALVRVTDREIRVDGLPLAVLPSPVREVVAAGDVTMALTASGLIAFGGPDGGPPQPLTDAGLPGTSSRGAVAGFRLGPGGVPLLTIYAELDRPGGTGLVQFFQHPMGWANTSLVAGCPDGGSPLQLSFDQDVDTSPLVFARCPDDRGGSYPVQVSVSPFVPRIDYRAVVENQVPFQWGVVSQRGAPFVRAHAGSNGRSWHATDPGAFGQLARLALRPVLLDRQPDTLFSFADPASQQSRVFAEAGGFIFIADPAGGFVSQLAASPVVPLNAIPGHTDWLVATAGLMEVSAGGGRILATLPSGETFTAPAVGLAVNLQLGSRTRELVLVASGDSLWLADVTDAQTGPFAQPAAFERVLVPQPGVRLRSMVLDASSDGGLAGYLTTSSANLQFGTTDLVRWSQTAVPTPSDVRALPLEVWLENNGQGRTGFTDGVVWSLPIMVPLTKPLATDGGALAASDFGRKCGDLFTVTREGLFRADRAGTDGGLPGWVKVNLPVVLDSTESLKLFETRDVVDRLFVGTQTGQVVEVTATCP